MVKFFKWQKFLRTPFYTKWATPKLFIVADSLKMPVGQMFIWAFFLKQFSCQVISRLFHLKIIVIKFCLLKEIFYYIIYMFFSFISCLTLRVRRCDSLQSSMAHIRLTYSIRPKNSAMHSAKVSAFKLQQSKSGCI